VVEVLHTQEISEAEIREKLSTYNFSMIENGKIKETDWLQKCFENFKPITVGDFYIYGPHLRGSPMPPDKITVEIAAATAFGTGEHPTTNRCLVACQTFFDEKQHKSVLDIGCGSCILSIALAKLGARNICACDCDEEAVRVARKNIVVNGVEHRIKVLRNEGCEFNCRKYDFIISNILAEPLLSMAKAITDSLAENAILILSGFTMNDNSVLQKYSEEGLKLKLRYDYRGWTTLVFKRKSAAEHVGVKIPFL
jgi:ribosomal protein L11 methyltransferase